MIFQHVAFPPLLQTPKVYYGNLNDIASAGGTLGTLTNAGFSSEGKVPTVYNLNLSLQHQLPLGMLLDAGYVGTVTRHGVARHLFNEAPFGSAWLPQNQDPTKCPNPATCNLNGDNAMPADFLRRYIGCVGKAGAPVRQTVAPHRQVNLASGRF